MKIYNKVYLCLQGPSIKQLEENIQYFKEHDVLWASLNRFSILEKNILSKIDKKFDMIYCSSPERFEEEYINLKNHRAIKFSNHEIHADFSIQVKTSWAYGFSSLFAFLITLLQMQYEAIYLFGADGQAGKEAVYYYEEEYAFEDFKARRNSIQRDTEIMNKYFHELREYWGIPYHGNIINVGLESAITCFPKIDIKQLL